MPIIYHDLTSADAAGMAKMRANLEGAPPIKVGPEGRPFFDDFMAMTPTASDIVLEAGRVGGAPGWWCRPSGTDRRAAVLYLHGGAYALGSAWAYRAFASKIAARAGADVFVADYALAPERPFPEAFVDGLLAYQGLVALGHDRIALCGDSAGGGLVLALLSAIARWRPAPLGAIAMSPWIDLTCSSGSMGSRAAVDPLLSRAILLEAARTYLSSAERNDARVSALLGDATALPPVLIHVGDDEVLLDDTLRYAALADAAGRQCSAHVWAGMVHVFPSNPALEAATAAMHSIGTFLRERLRQGASA